MPRCKDYTKYPVEYFDLLSAFEDSIRELGEEKGTAIVTFETEKDANKFRLEFYSYKGALELDGAAMDMFPHCQLMIVHREGKTVRLSLRDQQSHVVAVKKALEWMKR